MSLPNDERAALDAYWTPQTHASACVRFLLEHCGHHLPPRPRVVEPAVGGGSWARAVGLLLPSYGAIDVLDADPNAPGLIQRGRVGRAMQRDWLSETTDTWDLCIGNPPYGGDILRWLDLSLERAPVVGYLLRETVTGSRKRLPWWDGAGRPAWVVKVLPRPRWGGPGARAATDTCDSVFVIWVRGQADTRMRWLDVREGQ